MQRGSAGRRSCGSNGGSGSKIAGMYDLEETLGRGHFAVVKLARHVFTGEKVAVKVIDKTKLDDVSRAHLFQEVRCMKLVQHPNVVRLYEVIDTHSKLYLILELGDGGDLYDYIMKHESGLSEAVARDYFAQIVRAISYCHRLHVVHRDLKPENVVFFERLGIVKLTDFGFSNRFNPGQKLETSCGSLAYSAPEILLGDSYDAPAVDVWSLGVILYMLVCGQAPFQEANDSETLTMIMDCKYSVPHHVSEECARLISRMLQREPEKRATLAEIAADPWLAQAEMDDYSVPLISRQNISDEEHAAIVQKMVNGKIATKEEILEALEKDEYNHITATYFLLTERKLRAHLEAIQKSTSHGRNVLVPEVRVDSCQEAESAPRNRVNQNYLSMSRSPGEVQRTRKCSIVAEEEDDEDETSSHDSSHQSGLGRRGSRSEGKLNLAVQEIRREAIPTSIITEASTAPEPLTSKIPQRPVKTLPSPLPSALSSPQLGLKEIYEEGANPTNPKSSTRTFVGYEQRRNKFRKARTASCSSSDASDEDSESRKKRSSSKSLHRRDFQDPGGNGGSAGGNGPQNPFQDPPNDGSNSQNNSSSKSDSNDNTFGSGTVHGRRHCIGGRRRGRGCETRLRESQSLNRITEVQEAEAPLNPPKAEVPDDLNLNRLSITVEKDNINAPSIHHHKKNSSKRHAIIGRYLNFQRKICVPIFGKTKFHKPQTCLVNNRNVNKDINQNLGLLGLCHVDLGPNNKCSNPC
ncbi:uncharacterized protein Snrk isoform X1 [Bemisia tabaci]|uniref:uncharacterized protein Snrk isoform X1 n=1 Tax=Bemisia tabaci TaxID=7038 RepID=UPI0008F99945|nr:PREDICTED: SNF-related serine/threonine-protein kinase-like isoform X1 [Bemisia tabaci]